MPLPNVIVDFSFSMIVISLVQFRFRSLQLGGKIVINPNYVKYCYFESESDLWLTTNNCC